MNLRHQALATTGDMDKRVPLTLSHVGLGFRSVDLDLDRDRELCLSSRCRVRVFCSYGRILQSRTRMAIARRFFVHGDRLLGSRVATSVLIVRKHSPTAIIIHNCHCLSNPVFPLALCCPALSSLVLLALMFFAVCTL